MKQDSINVLLALVDQHLSAKNVFKVITLKIKQHNVYNAAQIVRFVMILIHVLNVSQDFIYMSALIWILCMCHNI